MNILIHYFIEISEENPTGFALIPSEKLAIYDLDKINGRGSEDFDEKIAHHVNEILTRLGLNPYEQGEADLAEYIDPKPPFQVDKLISIICS